MNMCKADSGKITGYDIYYIQKILTAEKIKMVGAVGLEPATFCSQSRRATNCAMPRLPVFRSIIIYSREKIFSRAIP